MKRLIFGLIVTTMFSTASFANTPTLENVVELQSENQVEVVKTIKQSTEESAVVTVTCTAVAADGTVYTATSGNWFTSEARATRDCKAKLFDLMFKQVGISEL
jgi:hypothetical protein